MAVMLRGRRRLVNYGIAASNRQERWDHWRVVGQPEAIQKRAWGRLEVFAWRLRHCVLEADLWGVGRSAALFVTAIHLNLGQQTGRKRFLIGLELG
jgi:hypothetical protein